MNGHCAYVKTGLRMRAITEEDRSMVWVNLLSQ